MEIQEDDDDFVVDDRFGGVHEIEDDDDIDMEENEFEEARGSKKAKPAASSTTTSRSKSKADDVEMVDAFGKQEKKLPLIEKYRPATLDEVVAQDDIVTTITKLMEKNALPHLLLYGPPGTGKTSTILAVARKMYGTNQLSSMVLELNASDSRGIDDIRDQVVTFASTRKIFSTGMKLVILDEADNMTRDAQFALRRVIEKYTSNTRFCMICNYVSKIIPALQSRCTRFRFSPLAPENVRGRVQQICDAESIECTDDGMSALLKLGRGDMRKVLNLLESSSMQQGSEGGHKPTVDAGLVYQVAGKPTPDDVDQIVNALLNDSLQNSSSKISSLQLEKGLALADIVTELHDRVRELDVPPEVSKFILKELAEVEYRLCTGVDDSIQLGGLIAVFMIARRMIEKGLQGL